MTLVPDYRSFDDTSEVGRDFAVMADRSRPYLAAKWLLELGFTTVVLLPSTLIIALALLVLNPFFNPGPLFYMQKRMGRDCRPFRALKFRTMDVRARDSRGHDDPVDKDRITPLGRLLRKSHFDELPQIYNLYRGEMSLIGPRPDTFRHAQHYVRIIPGYRARHMVLPGISGLAQIKLGYAEGVEATRAKTTVDLDYIARANLRLDLWIFWRTIVTVIRLRGA